MTNDELEKLPLPPIDCIFREDAIIKDKKFKKNKANAPRNTRTSLVAG